MVTAVRVSAPAKVNLFLGVGPVRPDGFHEVVTVLHALELADEVLVEAAEELSLVCEPDVGVAPSDNLAWRAAQALARQVGREAAARITVRKRLPHGAGLGGGSSDAAGVIAGLARLWGISPQDPRCFAAAASVGSDVPFFLADGGCALMIGRGEVLERTLPALAGVPVVLVRPPVPVPTAAAYAAFDARPVAPGAPGAVIAALESGDRTALASSLANNLVAAASAVVPEVSDALAWVQQQDGVLGATVAGSGSAVFAICGSEQAAGDAARAAGDHGLWSAATCLSPKGASFDDKGCS